MMYSSGIFRNGRGIGFVDIENLTATMRHARGLFNFSLFKEFAVPGIAVNTKKAVIAIEGLLRKRALAVRRVFVKNSRRRR